MRRNILLFYSRSVNGSVCKIHPPPPPLDSVLLYFAQFSTCNVSAIPSQSDCMLPSSSGIMMIHLLVPSHAAAPGQAGQRSPSLWSQNLEPNRSIVENNRLETHDSAHRQSCRDGWCGRSSQSYLVVFFCKLGRVFFEYCTTWQLVIIIFHRMQY